MCGINLILDKNNKLDHQNILSMNRAIAHRGPDESNFAKFPFGNSTIFLGANRLTITDPKSTIGQPLSTENDQHFLCFNGEIYNHQELRKYSEHSFRSNTDTESLLYGFATRGSDILSETNGMYAFIYVNLVDQSICFGRDPHGIKPLYYFENENYLIVSSELKGILASGLVEKKLNEESIFDYLVYRYSPPPHTFYQKIYEVSPGQLHNWTNSGTKKESISYKGKYNFSDENTVVKDTKELLIQAVSRQIPADVDAGLFLSGGIDSTLLLSIYQEFGLKNVPLFTIGNKLKSGNHGSDDFTFAQKAAKKFQAEIFPLEISEQVLHTFHDYINTIDQPVADNAGWLTWLLSTHSINKCKVIFSGAGADELFAGYNRHQAFKKYLSLMPFAIPGLHKLAKFPETGKLPFRNTFRLINKFASSIDNSPEKTWQNFISLNSFKKVLLINPFPSRSINFNHSKNYLEQALNHDLYNYLPNDVLKITDNSSMAVGQEIRVPFLDLELSHFARSIPAKLKLKHGKKWILKTILNQYVDKSFTSRSKSGFGMPLNTWLISKEGESLINIIKDQTNPIFHYLKFDEVQNIRTEHLSKKKDYSGELYSLIILAAWLKREFA